ncbi:MAG: DNA replication protein [Alphaproteobacteria bacterium]|nr:DNA replication protein [Alphaproteobacteria bacterium]
MKQLILPFEPSPAFGVKDFIVSSSNEGAYIWLMAWPSWPHPCLSIYGEKGCGKTHLSSIWQRTSKAQYFSARDFNAIELEALFEGPPVFILDDAHFIKNEEKLFHFYNHLITSKGSLLLLSQSAPARWMTNLPDLRSRLNAIPAIKINAPDEALLTQVLQKLFSDLQLKVDEAVICFLIKHMERSFESARRWTKALNAFALTERRNITVPAVRELLSRPDMVGIDQ